MALMNNLNKTPANQEYRPILRVRETEEAPVWSQQTECACPELCQIDHDN
jgi:hypothetical protein